MKAVLFCRFEARICSAVVTSVYWWSGWQRQLWRSPTHCRVSRHQLSTYHVHQTISFMPCPTSTTVTFYTHFC